MLKGKRFFLVVMVLVLSISLVACGADKGSQTPAPAKADTVKIGLIIPMTGASALYGEQAKSGADLAIKQINDKGGILGGRKIEVSIQDDKGNPEEGVSLVKKMIDDGYKYVTGGINSSVTLAQIPVTMEKGVMQVCLSVKAPAIRQQGHTKLFALNTDNLMDGEFFHAIIKDQLPYEKIAMMTENTDYGRAEIDALAKHWATPDSPKIITNEMFELTETDFTVLLSKIKAKKPDCLYVCVASPTLNGTIASQAKEVGLNVPILIAPGNLNKDVIKVGGPATEGIISADVYVNTIDNAENKEFVEAYKAMFNGKLPEKMEVLGYEIVTLTATAIDKAGSPDDVQKVVDIMRSTTWKTPRGNITFDAKGQAQIGLVPIIVKNGVVVLKQ